MSDDLEDLKRKKMKEKMQQGGQRSAEEQQREQMREKLKQISKQILTEDARERLNNIRVARPEMASQIEMQLVKLHKAGQIQDKITDDQLKKLLKKISDDDSSERTMKYR